MRSASEPGERTGPRRRRHHGPLGRGQSRRSQQHGDNDHKTTTAGARYSPARQPSTVPKLTARFTNPELCRRTRTPGRRVPLWADELPEQQSRHRAPLRRQSRSLGGNRGTALKRSRCVSRGELSADSPRSSACLREHPSVNGLGRERAEAAAGGDGFGVIADAEEASRELLGAVEQVVESA